MDDTLEGWERWALAISAGNSGVRCGLLSIGDPNSRRRTGDQPAASLGDEELALLFRRGDDEAFDLLYARYRAPLLRFVRRTMPNPSVDIAFGFLLAGRGEVWGADFELEKVGAAVPVTSRGPILPRQPINLNFEMAAAQGNAQGVADAPFPMIAAGSGRIFVYRTATAMPRVAMEVKLNGEMIGTLDPNYLYFFDRPPGDYTVAAGRTDTFSFGGFNGQMHPMDSGFSADQTVTFHLNPGEVRYVSLTMRRGSAVSVATHFLELVDAAVGRAQTEKILKSGRFKIKSSTIQ